MEQEQFPERKNFYFRKRDEIEKIIRSFSVTSKTIFTILFILLLVSVFGILKNLNDKFLVEVPEKGGSLTEGVIGTPRFINPLLANSETDKDLTALIFSGLTRKTSDGKIIPDLAERYEVSEDKLEYSFYLKENLTFHDGEKITADDVIFTILKAQDPEIRSPQRSNWDGIVVEKVSDRQINFRLPEPFEPFLENTTIGIIPEHLWNEISPSEFSLSRYNTEPVGSGPYKIKKIRRDTIDIPRSYELEHFENFSLGEPNLKKVTFRFTKNESELAELLTAGKIDSAYGFSPEKASSLEKDGYKILSYPLSRIFGIFFNQNESPILSNEEVRKALNLATPKQEIVNDVFYGYAELAKDPIPSSLNIFDSLSNYDKTQTKEEDRIAEAISILEKAGWTKNEEGYMTKETDDGSQILSFSISTNNVPELIKVAEKTIDAWKKIGAQVNLKNYNVTDLNQNVIRTRNFESLLFGIVINRESDLYAFWHSSQRNDPGLNITNYANITTDSLLEKIRDNSTDTEEKQEAVIETINEIEEDLPAIFLYTPKLIYVAPQKLSGLSINNISSAEDRFSNIYEWYVDTEKVWNFFE